MATYIARSNDVEYRIHAQDAARFADLVVESSADPKFANADVRRSFFRCSVKSFASQPSALGICQKLDLIAACVSDGVWSDHRTGQMTDAGKLIHRLCCELSTSLTPDEIELDSLGGDI